MKICILYSGGLDSLIMKRYAEVMFPDAEVQLLYYDIGHGYNYKEIEVLPDNVEIKKVDWLNVKDTTVSKDGTNSGNIFIPGRNLVFAVLAACQELPDLIWMGALLGETHHASTDKNFTFIQKINDTLQYVLAPFYDEDKTVAVDFPLANAGMGKYEAVEWFLENGGTLEEVTESSSCLYDEEGKCGRCVVCFRRWGILYDLLGHEEKCNVHPINDMDPANRKCVQEMIRGEMGEDCHYDKYRRREIIPALLKFHNVASIEELADIYKD